MGKLGQIGIQMITGLNNLSDSAGGGSGDNEDKDFDTLVFVDRFLPPTTFAHIPLGSNRNSSDNRLEFDGYYNRSGQICTGSTGRKP